MILKIRLVKDIKSQPINTYSMLILPEMMTIRQEMISLQGK